MPEKSLNVMAVVGSLNKASVTRVVVSHVTGELRSAGCQVDLVDFLQEPLALFNPDSAYANDSFAALRERVMHADAYVLGTPDYHGCMSSTIKNFLDHFWHEFAGKLFATIVASHEKGLTVTDQMRTVARQCYAWTLPYGVSFVDREDVRDGQVVSPAVLQRLTMMTRDIRIYGSLLARQRAADLIGNEPGFMARLREKPPE